MPAVGHAHSTLGRESGLVICFLLFLKPSMSERIYSEMKEAVLKDQECFGISIYFPKNDLSEEVFGFVSTLTWINEWSGMSNTLIKQ